MTTPTANVTDCIHNEGVHYKSLIKRIDESPFLLHYISIKMPWHVVQLYFDFQPKSSDLRQIHTVFFDTMQELCKIFNIDRLGYEDKIQNLIHLRAKALVFYVFQNQTTYKLFTSSKNTCGLLYEFRSFIFTEGCNEYHTFINTIKHEYTHFLDFAFLKRRWIWRFAKTVLVDRRFGRLFVGNLLQKTTRRCPPPCRFTDCLTIIPSIRTSRVRSCTVFWIPIKIYDITTCVCIIIYVWDCTDVYSVCRMKLFVCSATISSNDRKLL